MTVARRVVLRAAAALSLSVATALTAPVAAQAQVVLKFAPTVPPGNITYDNIWGPWAKKVNDAAQGEFRIEMVGPAIAQTTNVWERTVNGVVDIGSIVLGPSGLPFTKSNVTNLPGLMDKDAPASVALWRLFAKGLISEEYADVKVLALTAGPKLGITATKPITKLEDLKGAKVRAIGKVSADVLSALGASPIALPFGEVYQSLSRGVIVGGVVSNMSIMAFKSSEVAKNHTFDVAMGMSPLALVMNKAAYEKLSPKGKAIIDKFSGESESLALGTAWGKFDDALRDELKSKPDQKVHSMTPQEVERWKKAMEPVIQAWIKETPNGQQLVDTLKAEYANAVAGK